MCDLDEGVSFTSLEAAVIRRLLTRQDVQDSVRLALSGKQDEAAAALLVAVKGLLEGSIPAAEAKDKTAASTRRVRPRDQNDASDAAAKRPRCETQKPLAAKQNLGTEYWLEKSTRAVEVERLTAEERSRAKQTGEAQELTGKQSEKPLPLFWRIDLPEVTKVLSQRGVLPSTFLPVVRPHVTLLYLGGGIPEDRAAARAGLSRSQFQAAKATLERLKGQTLSVKMTEIIIEENVACAVVSLPADLPCGSKVPHVTLGTKHGVPAKFANEVLEEVKAGRKEGVTCIKLPRPKELKGVLDLETSASYPEKS
eukprot:TRINITY_DN30000_c0_g1_i1.p1 TRINITY_DN30000_c0_g1~~TRINITY_DN30000_c0_g1_i1.p1  ORF type:complete len:310 (-),score=73.89 TRINITY_DN30000_c0_g1_i1:204-1133(-)